MDKRSAQQTLASQMVLPCGICAASFALMLVMAIATEIRGTEILGHYWLVGVVSSNLALVLWMGLPWLRSNYRELGPFSAASRLVRERGILLILPYAIFPIFMTAFTILKISFPFLTGFHWDGFWTEADALIFNGDPWRVTHRLIGPWATNQLAFVYTFIWGAVLGITMPIYTFSATPGNAIRAWTALLVTWIVVGVAGAAAFSSAGPIFADLVDPSLGERFAPLRELLGAQLPADKPILLSQAYLRDAFGHRYALHGGGISAMPSMHLGVCAFIVFLAWNSRWRLPALLLWLLIWIGSVHFGFHYALDGIIGSLLAGACWKATAPRARPATGQAMAAMAPA